RAAQRGSGAAHRQRLGTDPVRDVGCGGAEPGGRSSGRPAGEPGQPRGGSVTGTATTYRLLALDLDGTVLGFDLRLDPRDVDAVGLALAAGIHVIACTGRPFPGALPWVRKLGLTDPFVCYQGAQVRTAAGETLLDSGV